VAALLFFDESETEDGLLRFCFWFLAAWELGPIGGLPAEVLGRVAGEAEVLARGGGALELVAVAAGALKRGEERTERTAGDDGADAVFFFFTVDMVLSKVPKEEEKEQEI